MEPTLTSEQCRLSGDQTGPAVGQPVSERSEFVRKYLGARNRTFLHNLMHDDKRRRVSSVVEHLSANPKVPGPIPGPVLYLVMDYDEACFMHLTPGVVHNFPNAAGVDL